MATTAAAVDRPRAAPVAATTVAVADRLRPQAAVARATRPGATPGVATTAADVLSRAADGASIARRAAPPRAALRVTAIVARAARRRGVRGGPTIVAHGVRLRVVDARSIAAGAVRLRVVAIAVSAGPRVRPRAAATVRPADRGPLARAATIAGVDREPDGDPTIGGRVPMPGARAPTVPTPRPIGRATKGSPAAIPIPAVRRAARMPSRCAAADARRAPSGASAIPSRRSGASIRIRIGSSPKSAS